jgi:ribosomal-protein-serine acetyltransferase
VTELVVRPWREDDAPALAAAVALSYEHLRPWAPWAVDVVDADRQRAWIREISASPGDRTYGAWLDDRLAGGCGLHARIGRGGLEIGYWTHVDFTRRGIATEMARRMCAIAFADPAIDHVEIHHDPANVGSARIPARLGFAPAGVDGEGHRVWRLARPA